jgi:hypothetical protein
MNSNIEEFYSAGKSPRIEKRDFWQHKCGLFQWPVSGSNVSLCCTIPELNKIVWPKIHSEEISGG